MNRVCYEDNGVTIVLFPIGREQEYLHLLTGQEREDLARMKDDLRRAEWAAWRAEVHSLLPSSEISYSPAGAPFIQGRDDLHIGVSHTNGCGAIVLSSSRCSIDVEWRERPMERAAGRFLSDAEKRIPGAERDDFKVSAWCAKEALYKYMGREGVRFREDMIIERYDPGECMIINSPVEAKAGGDARNLSYQIRFLEHEGYIVAYIA